MAKKVNAVFEAKLVKNTEKGGSWLATVKTYDEGVEAHHHEVTAWANASAAKRWVKARVQALTPKKSCKMIAGATLDEKNKPTEWTGEVKYKREI